MFHLYQITSFTSIFFNFQVTSKMYQYKIERNEWKETNTPMTEKRQSHSCSMINEGELIVIGGYDGTNHLSSSSIFNLRKQTWKQGPSLPTITTGHAQFVKSKTGSQYLGYLTGGYGDGGYSSAIYALKKDLSGFEKIGNLKTRRNSHVALLSQGTISDKCDY